MITVATAADLPAIAELRTEWGRERHGSSAVLDAGALRDWWSVERTRRTVLLATEAGVSVGMVSMLDVVRMPWADRQGGRWTYLAQLFVRPEARRRGHGAALVTEVVRLSRDRGCARVLLNPSRQGQSVFLGLGFQPATDLLVLEL